MLPAVECVISNRQKDIFIDQKLARTLETTSLNVSSQTPTHILHKISLAQFVKL